MSLQKFDFLIEAVHYNDDGKIAYVRGYERRGPTFSDSILLNRQQLQDLFASKKVVVTGKRLPYLGSSFQVSDQVKLIGSVISNHTNASQDSLSGVLLQ